MGKNKRERKDGEEKSPHAAATVCVSGLPYSITNAQVPLLILLNRKFGVWIGEL